MSRATSLMLAVVIALTGMFAAVGPAAAYHHHHHKHKVCHWHHHHHKVCRWEW